MKSLSRIVVLFGLLCAASNVQSANYYWKVYVNGVQQKVAGQFEWHLFSGWSHGGYILKSDDLHYNTRMQLLDTWAFSLKIELTRPDKATKTFTTDSIPWSILETDYYWAVYINQVKDEFSIDTEKTRGGYLRDFE